MWKGGLELDRVITEGFTEKVTFDEISEEVRDKEGRELQRTEQTQRRVKSGCVWPEENR